MREDDFFKEYNEEDRIEQYSIQKRQKVLHRKSIAVLDNSPLLEHQKKEIEEKPIPKVIKMKKLTDTNMDEVDELKRIFYMFLMKKNSEKKKELQPVPKYIVTRSPENEQDLSSLINFNIYGPEEGEDDDQIQQEDAYQKNYNAVNNSDGEDFDSQEENDFMDNTI